MAGQTQGLPATGEDPVIPPVAGRQVEGQLTDGATPQLEAERFGAVGRIGEREGQQLRVEVLDPQGRPC